MFQGIMDRAQRSVDAVVGKIVARSIIAVPFIIAVGFATAAIGIKLTEEFGSFVACLVLAVIFIVAGIIASVVYAPKTEAPKLEDATAKASERVDAKAKDPLIDPEALKAFASSYGPGMIPIMLRLAYKNKSIVVFLAFVSFMLFYPKDANSQEMPDESTSPAE